MSPQEVAAAVGEAVDPTSLMQRVCDRTLELIGAAEMVAIGLSSEQSITYVCSAGAGSSPVGTTVDMDSSLSGLTIKTGRIQRSDDTQCDHRVDAAACKRLSVITVVCVPLSRSSEIYGVLAINASHPHAFSDADVAVLTQLADFVSVAIGSARDLDRASHQLLNLGNEQQHTADETTGRYVMNVLDPATVPRIDARHRIQQILDSPEVLAIVFQPVIDLFSSNVVAVEALSRFNAAPARPPDAWFEDAHHAGCGPELEMLAITRALAHLSMLPGHIALSINVGPNTLVGSNLQEALADVPARRIVLELTEHNAFDDYPALRDALMTMRSAGFRLAVDDAGSGYSSLAHILQLAPDFIKLDRELISGIDVDPVRRALVTSLVAFAADTGAEILAEGIESKDELDAVSRLGVRYAQGYYLGRPASLDALDLDHIKQTPYQKPPGGLIGALNIR